MPNNYSGHPITRKLGTTNYPGDPLADRPFHYPRYSPGGTTGPQGYIPPPHSGVPAIETPGTWSPRSAKRSGIPLRARQDVLTEFGITPNSAARLRNEAGEFIAFDARNKVRAELMTQELAEELLRRLKANFSNHNTYQNQDPNWRRTIDTFAIHPYGMEAVIRMGGAASFVYYGTPPHPIFPSSGITVRFTGQGGELVYRNEVFHPGMPSDPFIDRAMAEVGDTGLAPAMGKFTSKAYLDIRPIPSSLEF